MPEPMNKETRDIFAHRLEEALEISGGKGIIAFLMTQEDAGGLLELLRSNDDFVREVREETEALIATLDRTEPLLLAGLEAVAELRNLI